MAVSPCSPSLYRPANKHAERKYKERKSNDKVQSNKNNGRLKDKEDPQNNKDQRTTNTPQMAITGHTNDAKDDTKNIAAMRSPRK
jgi:hypothetical protein